MRSEQRARWQTKGTPMSEHYPVPQPAQGYWTTQPVVVPMRTPHGLHMLFMLFTLGLWLPMWIGHALLNAGKTEIKQVPVWVPTYGAPQPVQAPVPPQAA